MASFTDKPMQFNPYIQQLPVEEMVKVGMIKQDQYDKGVQKIQGQIDQVAGLEVMRGVDKAYLQSKLNELGGNLTTVAAGDFSNFQLVNSVGGMVKQVGNDKYVQAAVSSTANHKKQVSDMSADKKKGTLTPDNEYYYDKQISSYLNSTDIKDAEGNPVTFSGKYISNFDVFKFAKETFDAVKPDGFSFDQVYETDANGNPKKDVNGQPIYSPVMVRMEKEGIFPQKVKETLNQIFSDPRVGQQLSISGQYTYRGLDGNALSQKVLSQKTSLINAYDDELKKLNIQKNLGKDVKVNIDNITLAKKNANTVYDEYASLAIENPDAVRGQLYKDDVNSRYTTMFGWMKSKEQQMDNPGWNANFRMLEEANEQSRFAQTLRQNKIEHADAMRWKQKEYDQKQKEIDDKKDDAGLGANNWTQGDQAAAYDVIYKVESDYEEAASNFKASAGEFLWATSYSGGQGNEQKLTDMMAKGMSRSQAISNIISNNAKANGQTEEEFITGWGNYGVKQYNKLSQKERDKLPGLKDAYAAYSNARTNFDGMSAVKKKIDTRYRNEVGAMADDANITKDIPNEQVINFEGKDLKLNKRQVFDMAIYLRGERSSFGFLEGDAARNASKEAFKRLEAAGLGNLANNVLNEHTTKSMFKGDLPGPVTFIVRAAKTVAHDIRYGDYKNISGLVNQVAGTYNKLNDEEYETGLNKKADIIKEVYGIRGNKKTEMLTGDVKGDKNTIFKLRGYAGAYEDGQTMNLSRDFGDFAKSISGDITGMSISTNVYMDKGGEPQIEVISYDKSGKRAGGMTIQPDEALKLGIDVNKIYEPKEIGVLRNKINVKGGQTSDGSPKEISTYINGDVQYDRSFFPSMENSPYDVKANITYNNGIYYPYLYVSDGRTENVRQLPGSDDLYKLAISLQRVSPTFAQQILNEK